jgi:4-hydroxybenzoate polyprenyltransferase
MNWRLFIAAALSVAIALFAAGAPPTAITAGIVSAALWNYRSKTKSGRTRSKDGDITPSTRMVNL